MTAIILLMICLMASSVGAVVGAVIGGLVGKWLFELVKNGFGNERVLGAIRSVFFYMCVIKINYRQKM